MWAPSRAPLRARVESSSGTPSARSSQSGEVGCSRACHVAAASARATLAGIVSVRAPIASAIVRPSTSGSAAMLKAPRTFSRRGEPVGLAHVERVDELDDRSGDVREDREPAGLDERAREERAGEEAADALGALALHDQRRAQGGRRALCARTRSGPGAAPALPCAASTSWPGSPRAASSRRPAPSGRPSRRRSRRRRRVPGRRPRPPPQARARSPRRWSARASADRARAGSARRGG